MYAFGEKITSESLFKKKINNHYAPYQVNANFRDHKDLNLNFNQKVVNCFVYTHMHT